jgi:DNA-binding transcriptional LysR family regulator
MPELSALEVFLAVAQAGSLNAAASELGVSQQAVSARIAAIERQTGVSLVWRTPRGSQLAPAGVVVSEWASRVLALAAEMDEGLAALQQEARTTLRLAASVTLAEYLLPGWLMALRELAFEGTRPQVTVNLIVGNTSAVLRHVQAQEVDLGLIEGAGVPRGLHHRTIGSDRLVVVVLPSHPWVRRGRAPSVWELARAPLITRELGSGTREVFDLALRRALAASPTRTGNDASGRLPAIDVMPPALELPTTAGVRTAVIAGAGPAVLSELAVVDDVAAGRLRVIDIDGLDLRRRFRAIWTGASQPGPGPVRDLIALAIRASSSR